jgi:hypothetical protein
MISYFAPWENPADVCLRLGGCLKNLSSDASMAFTCVTSQDLIKFWGIFFVFILLVLIENLQRF